MAAFYLIVFRVSYDASVLPMWPPELLNPSVIQGEHGHDLGEVAKPSYGLGRSWAQVRFLPFILESVQARLGFSAR